MAVTRHVIGGGTKIQGKSKDLVLFLSSFLHNSIALFDPDGPSSNPLIFRDKTSLKGGFNYFIKHPESGDYLLISYWDNKIKQSAVKLVRIRDGKTMYTWIPDIQHIVELVNLTSIYGIRNNYETNYTGILHPKLLDDGSIVFSAGGIFKIDKHSKLMWYNLTSSHHSIETGPEGNLWICSYNSSRNNSEKYQIMDDAIKEISLKTGKILFEKSIFDILMENGYSHGSFFINPFISIDKQYLDQTHLNQVQPVMQDSKFWKKGDLFISLRHQNLVFLYRPSTNKIIWSMKGHWLKQHDVDILDSNRIFFFGNNVIDAKFDDPKRRFIDGHNEIYVYDFSKDQLTTPFHTLLNKHSISTYTEGRVEILGNSDVFIEETNKGKLYYGNAEEIKWIYIDRIGKNEISKIGWSRYITGAQFSAMKFLHN